MQYCSRLSIYFLFFFFFQAEDGIRDLTVTGVQTCALPISQGRGLAKEACKLAMAWAFDTAKLERVIACIGDGNDGARAIATKLGMTELGSGPSGTTVYVKDRGKRKRVPKQGRNP